MLMKTCAIITEYNPFHNGHIYHIKKARELSGADIIIAIMSGNISMRGDLSVMDKFAKTKAALENGVDLVVELPFVHTVQNASIFAKGAIDIAKRLDVDTLCFGSETNNLENLKEIADTPIDPDHLKEALKTGISYPKAYSLLADSLYPNDILAVAYLKELKGSNITPISIQRTNGYHDIELNEIASASAIRKAIKDKKDYHIATPSIIDHPVFLSDLYPDIRRHLLLSDPKELEKIHLVSEGIEKMLVKNALKYSKYDDFLSASVSRRYTRSRIQRILIWIMCGIKEEMLPKETETYIRILGFKKETQSYLKELKERDIKLLTQLKHIPKSYKDIEYRASVFYALAFKEDPFSEYLLKRELQGPVIV